MACRLWRQATRGESLDQALGTDGRRDAGKRYRYWTSNQSSVSVEGPLRRTTVSSAPQVLRCENPNTSQWVVVTVDGFGFGAQTSVAAQSIQSNETVPNELIEDWPDQRHSAVRLQIHGFLCCTFLRLGTCVHNTELLHSRRLGGTSLMFRNSASALDGRLHGVSRVTVKINDTHASVLE